MIDTPEGFKFSFECLQYFVIFIVYLLHKSAGHMDYMAIITGLQIRVGIGKIFSLFLIQNICCGYSKEPSQ